MARAGIHDLNSLLDVLEHDISADRGDVTTRDVLQTVGRRAYGPLLLVIGVISVSPVTVIPGATWAFAALTLVVALQLLFHRDAPWMPRGVLDMRVPAARLRGFIRRVRPTAKALDHVIRPRLTFMTDAPWVSLVALACAAAALVTFPLGLIPFGPVAPGIAIILFGLGMTARDGLVLSGGILIMAGAGWFVFSRFF